MYFDYERFVNIFSSMVAEYRYDVVHSNNPNRDTSDEFGVFDDMEMREMLVYSNQFFFVSISTLNLF
jgi:hypothetical protein